MVEESAASYLVHPPSGSGPGVLVLHAWWGLNQFFRDFCDRVAGQGFVVLAPDLYHGEVASTIDQAKALRGKLKGAQVSEEIQAAVTHLQGLSAVAGPGLGVIGFSLGGRFALELSLQNPDAIRAVTVFYALLHGDYSPSRSAYLCHFAETDPYAADSGKMKFEKALRAAHRPAEVYTYPGTGHWFFEQDRPEAYNAVAAQLAWTRTLQFLHACLDQA